MSFKNTKEQLSEYISPVFFETGTYLGETCITACDLGFERVITIELFKEQQDKAMKNCYGYDIEFHLGKSVNIMESILPNINSRITFWLDAHISSNQNPMGTDENPLMQELDIIKNFSKRNDNIILIDDLRILGKHGWGIGTSIEEVVSKIMEINSLYEINYLDGLGSENDILVAKIK
jgi:hypothetical protein